MSQFDKMIAIQGVFVLVFFMILHFTGVSRMARHYGVWRSLAFFFIPVYGPAFIMLIDKNRMNVFSHWIWKGYALSSVLVISLQVYFG